MNFKFEIYNEKKALIEALELVAQEKPWISKQIEKIKGFDEVPEAYSTTYMHYIDDIQDYAVEHDGRVFSEYQQKILTRFNNWAGLTGQRLYVEEF